jgi:hypothetical protein
MARCALVWIGLIHLDAMVIYMTTVRMVQVAVVKVVGMAVVLHGRVTAIRAMLVAVSA